MKLKASILVLILAATVQASQRLDVLLNNNGNVSLIVVGPAEAFAARILASADIALTWHTSLSSTRKDGGRLIVVDLQGTAPPTERKGALGYSLLSDGVHVCIFYDRIRRFATQNEQPYLLAHAMAHEIAHLLQGVPRHSTTGVMKANWDGRDIFEMRHLLAFTPEDIRTMRSVNKPSYLSNRDMNSVY